MGVLIDMCDKQNNSLDNLFEDADQGICSNNVQNSIDVGLTNLSEGLNTLTYGLNRKNFVYETSEKHKEDN